MLAVSKEMKQRKGSNIIINITPNIRLTRPIEVYPVTNVVKNFVTTKFWQILKLSHSIVMGGGTQAMYNQITFIFSKE